MHKGKELPLVTGAVRGNAKAITWPKSACDLAGAAQDPARMALGRRAVTTAVLGLAHLCISPDS